IGVAERRGVIHAPHRAGRTAVRVDRGVKPLHRARQCEIVDRHRLFAHGSPGSSIATIHDGANAGSVDAFGYALIASDWPADCAAINCAWCWIIRSITLCAHADGLALLAPGAGTVIVTCEPSAYEMVVVVEPSELVTVLLLSAANGSLDESVENG